MPDMPHVPRNSISSGHIFLVKYVLESATSRPELQALPSVAMHSQAETDTHAGPAEVMTAQELLSAVAHGRRHVRLVDHVDLRRQPLPWPGMQQSLGFVPWTTRSITVRPSYVGLKVMDSPVSNIQAPSLRPQSEGHVSEVQRFLL